MTKTITVSIIGKPNAGKSTLLNRVLKQKISIVTPKVQTTRHLITGITTVEDTQFIFIDTPGIFEPKKNLERAMVRAAWSSIVSACVVVVILDATKEIDDFQRSIIERLNQSDVEYIILLNKIDLVKDHTALISKMSSVEEFNLKIQKIFCISAKNGDGVDELLSFLQHLAKVSPWLYGEDDVTTLSMRFLAQECTRERLFLALNQELPYHLTVDTESWEVMKNGSVKIRQVIMVGTEGHKKIILGKNGEMIKYIGQNARLSIKEMLNIDAHLFLFVKVRENWDNDLCKSIHS